MLSNFFREVRLALRGIGRRPGFAAAVIGTLALAIGANTAIFTVVRAVAAARAALRARRTARRGPLPRAGQRQAAVPDRRLLRHLEANRSFEALVALRRLEREPHRRRRAGIGCRRSGLARVLRRRSADARRARPHAAPRRGAAGRPPRRPARRRVVAEPVRRRPGHPRRRLTLNAEPYEVIGVLPPGFPVPDGRRSPARRSPRPRDGPAARPPRRRRSCASSAGCARARAPEAAKQDLDAIVARLRAAYPDDERRPLGSPAPAARRAASSETTADAPRPPGGRRSRPPDRVHQPGQPAARPAREPPPGARGAHGPRRPPAGLARQLLTETAVLALLGGLLGLGLATAA